MNDDLCKAVASHLPAALESCKPAMESSGKLTAINWGAFVQNALSDLPKILPAWEGVLVSGANPAAIAAAIANTIFVILGQTAGPVVPVVNPTAPV